MKKAFTLIDLVTTIGITGVLIGITLPAMSSARNHARKTICDTNLRTIHQAYSLYRNDHFPRDLIPKTPIGYDIRSANVNPFATAMLDVYKDHLDVPFPAIDSAGETRTQKPFLCPSDNYTLPLVGGRTTGCSYWYYPAITMYPPWFPPLGPKTQREMTRRYDLFPTAVLYTDADTFHVKKASPNSWDGRNTVRMDGSVRKVEDYDRTIPDH